MGRLSNRLPGLASLLLLAVFAPAIVHAQDNDGSNSVGEVETVVVTSQRTVYAPPETLKREAGKLAASLTRSLQPRSRAPPTQLWLKHLTALSG